MRVSAKAEYACIAMLELAANHAAGQPIRVKDIADHHGIPQRFLVQILLQLKGAGLVASIRGAAGGYRLARAPVDISLANVINAIDRSLEPWNSTEASAHSPVIQAVRGVWKEIQAEEQRRLEELTLSELVGRSQQTNAISYQI